MTKSWIARKVVDESKIVSLNRKRESQRIKRLKKNLPKGAILSFESPEIGQFKGKFLGWEKNMLVIEILPTHEECTCPSSLLRGRVT